MIPNRALNIGPLLHVSIIVTDVARALHFYHDLLGIEINSQRPDLGYPGAWLQIGTQQIHLLQVPNPDPISGRPLHGGRDRHAAFGVQHFDALMSRLDTAQVPYTLSKSGRRALFCRDPDGNALEFVAAD